MAKLVIVTAKDLRLAFKQGRDTVNDTAKIVRAHARQISYEDKIQRLEKQVGSKVNGILSAFDKLSKVVARRIGKTELVATSIVTPEVVQDILTPYKAFLSSMGGAKSIEDAVAFMEEKRKKELDTYGKTELLRANINRYFDLQIDKYLLPLQAIEAQVNEMNKHLKYTGAKINTVTKVVNKIIKIEAPKEEATQEI